jgi:tetratricopeptide (TPR) repeat protein
MIMDNADDADMFFGLDTTIADSKAVEAIPLSKYIPECSHGAILVTTRTKIVGQKLARGRCLIKVLPMNKEESVELFRKQFHEECLDTDKLDELTRELEGLPLALAQAAAFIQMNSLTFSTYLKLYKENDEMKTKLLSERFEAPGRDSEVPNPVIATFMISFEHIKRTTHQAARILSLMALLDRQGIPESLIQGEAANRLELEKALGTLKAFSLISTNEANDAFDMHRLVHLATRNWLRLIGEFDSWAISCLKTMSEEFPSGEYGTLDTCDLYLPHAKAALSYMQLSSANDVDRAHLAYRMSRHLYNRGSYSVANTLAEQALGLCEKVLGKEHLDTLTSMSNLALVLDRQGKYEEAEKMNRRTLELYERVLGKEHPDTLMGMSNLAMALDGRGKYSEAEEMNRRTLELKERVLGKDHPNTLASMNNLAWVLDKQGKYEQAEEMNRRTLEMRERVLGEEHPDTLMSMSNLAIVLDRQGKYSEVEEMNRRTLEMRERVLGEEHPDTLTSMSNLALVFNRQGKYEQAEEMNRRTLELYERVLGEEHPDTLTSMSNLAGVFELQGKYSEAEEMNRRTLEMRERVLGEEHPDTLTSIYWLAYLLQNWKRYDSSSVLYQKALLGYQKKLGLDHPTTLACSVHYSSLLEEMK